MRGDIKSTARKRPVLPTHNGSGRQTAAEGHQSLTSWPTDTTPECVQDEHTEISRWDRKGSLLCNGIYQNVNRTIPAIQPATTESLEVVVVRPCHMDVRVNDRDI